MEAGGKKKDKTSILPLLPTLFQVASLVVAAILVWLQLLEDVPSLCGLNFHWTGRPRDPDSWALIQPPLAFLTGAPGW